MKRKTACGQAVSRLSPRVSDSMLGACSRILSELDVPPSLRYSETSERLPRQSLRTRCVFRAELPYVPSARLTHAPLAASAASTSGKIRNTRSSREVSKIERKVSCKPLRKNFPPYASTCCIARITPLFPNYRCQSPGRNLSRSLPSFLIIRQSTLRRQVKRADRYRLEAGRHSGGFDAAPERPAKRCLSYNSCIVTRLRPERMATRKS